jgi:hypothetical protein
MANGASIALQVLVEEAAEAETATITLVDKKPVKAIPMASEEIALRMKNVPLGEAKRARCPRAACPRLIDPLRRNAQPPTKRADLA